MEAASRGVVAQFDEERVKEIESIVPNLEFAPDDIQTLVFNAKENNHGLGYNPLQEIGVLQQNYGSLAKGLKTSKKGKAIRGQVNFIIYKNAGYNYFFYKKIFYLKILCILSDFFLQIF